MPIGRLHVLTDFHLQQRYSHAELARLAIDGGADTVQFRQKRGFVREKLHEARRVQKVCQAHGIPLIIDDHIDITLAVGAAGVHLGQTDFPIDAARDVMGDRFLIGATVTTPAQAEEAVLQGADYLGFGPVFPTHSKDNPASVKGLRGLEKACMGVDIPVVAIGGIGVENVLNVLEAGAQGVAVMSAVILADNPSVAARDIRSEIDRYFGDKVETSEH